MLQGSARNYRYVYLVALLSLLYLGFLVSSAQPGVFFSSDGGVKYMVVKQFTEGHGFKYMYLPQPQWVQQIWNTGFFPFRPPFLYPSPQGYLFVFPPAFQLISAFFYQHFGNAGLYIIPVLSTILLWMGFVFLLKRSGVTPNRIALGLFILVFCSPLTIYGATYWEHMTAILLLFYGLSWLVRPSSKLAGAFFLGLLSGLAAWFRPEAMMMNVLYGIAVLYLFFRSKQRGGLLFLAGIALGVASFLIFNKLEFDSFFGIHSRQVLQDSVEGGVDVNPFRNLIANNLINARHFLFILLILPAAYLWIRHKRPLSPRTGLLVLIVLVYCALTPFMVPNDGGRQWGARYFLPVLTVSLVALLLIVNEWKLRMPLWLAAVIFVMAVYSFHRNTYSGGLKTLVWENHHRISPSMNYVERQPGNVVVVSYPYIAMELGYIFDQKYFFLAPDNASLQRLLPLLKRQGIHDYTYIYDVRVPAVRATMLTDTLAVWPHNEGDFEFRHYTIQ